MSVAVLALSMSLLCIFGACLGLYLFRLDFSITALLGLVSLIGIIVRNAIIMYEYAEQLRKRSLRQSIHAAYFPNLLGSNGRFHVNSLCVIAVQCAKSVWFADRFTVVLLVTCDPPLADVNQPSNL